MEEEKKKLSEISITGNKISQDPDNLGKKANKQDYEGGTNDKTRDSLTRETSDSPSDTDSCARNLDKEHKNKEDADYIEPPSKKKR